MIKFFNIRSKEVRVAETEPLIAALWASSDHSPNITQGQDFGWRLAPEVVVEMKRIKQDWNTLTDIAKRIGKNVDEVTEPDILDFISHTNQAAQNAIAKDQDYTDEYNEEIRRLEIAVEAENPAVAPTQPQESLEDLQKRVELEERLAAARAKNAEPATPATPDTTTTPDTGDAKTDKPEKAKVVK